MSDLPPALENERHDLCLPLDGLGSLAAIRYRVQELAGYVGLFKVGKETFTRFGPDAVKAVKDEGGAVFLDLKYHDIPATVRGAARAASKLGVRMFNVHASGGTEMMRAAREGVTDYMRDAEGMGPSVLGVTVLTSHDLASYARTMQPLIAGIRDLDLTQVTDQEIGSLLDGARGDLVQRHVAHLARMAHRANLDGVVCSAVDLPAFRAEFGPEFMYVTPGIAGPSTGAGSDQKRVVTPYDAVKNGSSILVVGRAITKPDTPEGRQAAAYSILEDMARARREISPM